MVLIKLFWSSGACITLGLSFWPTLEDLRAIALEQYGREDFVRADIALPK